MDLKILLRYQISGSIFIGWFLLFHYSVHSADFADMATKIMDISSLASLIIAMPIGAIIHQFSVTIKNQIYGGTKGLFGEGCYQLLSDSPQKYPTRLILEKYKNDREFVQYISDKISNLNSFYYMRFDCGFLAPLLTLILFIYIDNYNGYTIVMLVMLLLLPTFFYIIYFIGNKSWICLLVNLGFILLIMFAALKILPLVGANQTSINYVESSTIGDTNITKTYSVERKESISNYIQYFEKGKITNDDLDNKFNFSQNDIESIGYSIHDRKSATNVNITIKPLNSGLLNEMLSICLIISFLLLSYIPRIIQELQEYTDKLKKIQPSENNAPDNNDECCQKNQKHTNL